MTPFFPSHLKRCFLRRGFLFHNERFFKTHGEIIRPVYPPQERVAAEVFSSRCAILTWLILELGCTSSFIGSACRDQLACTDFPLFYYSELGAPVPHLRVGKGVDQYTVRRFLDRLQAEPRYRPS